jgi:hypothetical protein
MDSTALRARLREILRSLDPEDLEERVAPVKCQKHPDSPECDVVEYGVPLYMCPPPPRPEGGDR